MLKKSDFFYPLPDHLIAQFPLPARNASRLLCMKRGCYDLSDRNFGDFIELINENDLLVFNDTKVIPARLFGRKATGGKVEILIERLLDNNQALALMRASKSPKIGADIELDQGYQCRVISREGDLFRLQFPAGQSLDALLDKIGHIPLPPYIERADNQTDRTRYQTVFAKQPGAVAAPTAGLHFDQEIMAKIGQKAINTAFVTLHVGSGTFQPVRTENLADHRMHKEYYSVSPATVTAVKNTRKKGGRVIAIGTTAVRAIESASRTGKLIAGIGDTDLFITPGYRFVTVDGLLTNFHLPESTLIMLVCAFAGYEQAMAAYQHAVQQSYRFFSYGDAMFIC